jgi:hypothetical protein
MVSWIGVRSLGRLTVPLAVVLVGMMAVALMVELVGVIVTLVAVMFQGLMVTLPDVILNWGIVPLAVMLPGVLSPRTKRNACAPLSKSESERMMPWASLPRDF